MRLEKDLKFKAVHKMRATKFVIEDIDHSDVFGYRIRAYEVLIGEQWQVCNFTEEVAIKWFWDKKLTKLE